MNSVGKNAIKMGCIQVLPGKEFKVVKALKKACQSSENTKSIIFKGLGFYDIFLIYESKDFKSFLTPAGTIPGIVNSNTYLCFPYLTSKSDDLFLKLSNSRVEDGRGGFRLSVAVGISFDTPPQSDLP